jgi:FkbM family methyltransferase
MALAKITERFQRLLRHPVFRRQPLLTSWRAAMWSAHCLLRIPARSKFRRWNYRLYLPAKWKGGGATSPYLFRELYEPELMLLERFLQPGMVFVDGGANTGVFTFTAASIVGEKGRVLSFEPGAVCFDALKKSTALNRFSQVQPRQQALSDRTGIARFYHHHDQENSFSLGGDDAATFDEVSTITLDEVADVEQLPRVDFIKLDVEGAEELVLRGAKDVLTRWQPVVLFEINLDAIQRLNLQPDGACRVLKEFGYELFHMEDDGVLTASEEIPDRLGNLLAIPAKLTSRAKPQAETEQLLKAAV